MNIWRTDPHFIRIDHGIPLPLERGRWGQVLQSMRSGDSFVAANDKERCCVLRSAKYAGIGVTSIKIDGKGFRVWRK